MIMAGTTSAPNRAGRYVHQTSGYRAFVPAPLPPDPPLRLGGELQQLLSSADRALGRLDGSVFTLPNPDLFVFMYVRKEAVLSSQIEGTQSSLQDLLAAEAALFEPELPRDVDEVVNYVRAMNHGLARLQELPVSVRLIREIHAELLQGVRGGRLQRGELRTTQNWLGPAGSTLANATFVPPPPHEVAGALGDLEKFIHREDDLPPIVRIALAHVQFETIHPFLDGNGRVGRLLVTLLLCAEGLLAEPMLYLSLYLKQHRARYYELLMRVRTDGAWEEWLDFFTRGVIETATSAVATARRLTEQASSDRARIQGIGRTAGNVLRVHAALLQRPVATAQAVSDRSGLSVPTVNRMLADLKELRIVRELTGRQRGRLFSYDPYLSILGEGTEPL